MKLIVIGDTHFEDAYPFYLESQIYAVKRIVYKHDPDAILFLGDIFHSRKPSPKVIIAVAELFNFLGNRCQFIDIIRGNHDTMSKSDTEDSILSILGYIKNVTIHTRTTYVPMYNSLMIPHYENDEIIINVLKQLEPESYTNIFGHFGYKGCLNIDNNYAFTIDPMLLRNMDVTLGHIHKFSQNGDITILGTPWGTSFGETDYTHYIAEYEVKNDKLINKKYHEVDFGPRFYVCPFESLELMKDDISDHRYDTVLRVLLNRFNDDTTNDLRSKIQKEYNVKYVDFKFQPIFDVKLDKRLSDYDPQSALVDITDNIIEKYLEEQKSSIPTEDLKKGLEMINNYADQEDKD